MVNKEMKFLDNGDIRYEVVDEAARSNIQQINTTLDNKANVSDLTALDDRVTALESGGSGMSSDNNVLLVTVTMSNEISGMADKSYAEVIEAWNAGKVIRLYASALGGEVDITAHGGIGAADEYFMAMLSMISGSQVGYMVVTMIKGATDSDMMSVVLQF